MNQLSAFVYFYGGLREKLKLIYIILCASEFMFWVGCNFTGELQAFFLIVFQSSLSISKCALIPQYIIKYWKQTVFL